MKAQITYILSEQEVKEVLMFAQVLKPYKWKVVALFAAAIVAGAMSVSPSNPYTYFNILPLALVVLFAALGYSYNERKTIRGATTGESTTLSFFDDYINVKVPNYDADWNILAEDVARITESENLHIIMLKDTRIMALPKRVVDSDTQQKILETFDKLTCQDNKTV